MKINSLLTYLLYALLFGLIFSAGYMAYKTRQEKLQQAQNDQDINNTLRDLGYSPSDSAAATGSTYATGSDENGNASANPSSSAQVSRDGIEEEPAPAPTKQTPKTVDKTSAARQTPKTVEKTPVAQPAPDVSPKPAATHTTGKSVTGPTAPSKNLNADKRGGRYQVRAGSFSVQENARDLLEKVIKMGYQQAEIGKLNGGKFATVVVARTNDRARAVKIMDELENKGVDAFVFDTQRK